VYTSVKTSVGKMTIYG